MKKNITRTALILLTAPFLTHCVAAEKDVRSIDLRTKSINMRLSELEKNLGSTHSQSAAQADISDTMDRLNNRLLQLEGKLDEGAHSSQAKQDALQSKMNALTDQVQNLAQKVNALETRSGVAVPAAVVVPVDTGAAPAVLDTESAEMRQLRAREAADRALAASRAAEEARLKAQQQAVSPEKPIEIAPTQVKKKPGETEAVSPAPAAVQAPPPPAPATVEHKAEPAPVVSAAEKTQYDAAYELFKAKNYKQAYNSFSDFLSKHPKSGMAANARFWLGDSLYNQNEFELAILEYQRVIADFPSSPKAPAALLKQGLAFEKLHEKATARIVYNKLLSEYPDSEQAATARQRLESLK